MKFDRIRDPKWDPQIEKFWPARIRDPIWDPVWDLIWDPEGRDPVWDPIWDPVLEILGSRGIRVPTEKSSELQNCFF